MAKSIQDKIRYYCAYQERCTQEVILKLRALKVGPERIDAFVQELKDEGYLNDVRYAHAYARGKFRMKSWGKLHIQQGLFAKGIPSDMITEAMEAEIDMVEYRRVIRRLAQKLTKGLEYEPDESELIYALTRKGFSYTDVMDALKESDPEDNPDINM